MVRLNLHPNPPQSPPDQVRGRLFVKGGSFFSSFPHVFSGNLRRGKEDWMPASAGMTDRAKTIGIFHSATFANGEVLPFPLPLMNPAQAFGKSMPGACRREGLGEIFRPTTEKKLFAHCAWPLAYSRRLFLPYSPAAPSVPITSGRR